MSEAPRLTERHLEILSLVASGLSTKEIAVRLAIAEPTVKWHLARIFARLGATNRAEAVSVAYEIGALHDVPHRPTLAPPKARPDD